MEGRWAASYEDAKELANDTLSLIQVRLLINVLKTIFVSYGLMLSRNLCRNGI